MVVSPTVGARLSVGHVSQFLSFKFHGEILGLDTYWDCLEGEETEAKQGEVACLSSRKESRCSPGT